MSTTLVVAVVIGALAILAGLYFGRQPPAPPSASPKKKPARPEQAAGGTSVPHFDLEDEEDEEEDITLVTVRLDLSKLTDPPGAASASDTEAGEGGRDYADMQVVEIDEDLEPAATAHRFVADDGAEEDVPTMAENAFIVSSARQSDQGKRRKRNEDCFLARPQDGIFVVADGMGGYAGGDIASNLAANTISDAFERGHFVAKVFDGELPRRAQELAQAMQAANLAIWEQATDDPKLRGMGTTLVATRFALRKKRVYIGHVGDSRCYRVRGGAMRQLTQDHTLEAVGYTGPGRAKLIRAVGIGSEVEIDVIIAEPKLGDVYLLCSDGLTKMVKDAVVEKVLVEEKDLDVASQKLIDLALEAGGKDNVTVVLVGIVSPVDIE